MDWTLEELVGRVAQALGGADVRPPNGRVTEVPDVRMIRWYVTSGLVDRPHAMRGRVGLYGRRHLLQLVAIKRRQSEGHRLADIQAELAGATDDELAAIARIPADEPPPPKRDRFWAQRPAPPSRSDATSPASPAAPIGAASPEDAGDGVLRGIKLGEALLLVPGTPEPADLTAIRAAAQPLLDLLVARGLVPGPSGPTPRSTPTDQAEGAQG